MARGRKPKPTKLKILEGAQKCRINRREPQYKSIKGEPPAFLDEQAAEEWRRVWPEIKQVITVVDKMALAAYCVAYSRWRSADEFIRPGKKLAGSTPNGSIQQSPYVAMARNWLLAMGKMAVELGFTPSSRSKVIATAEEDKNEKFLFGKK